MPSSSKRNRGRQRKAARRRAAADATSQQQRQDTVATSTATAAKKEDEILTLPFALMSLSSCSHGMPTSPPRAVIGMYNYFIEGCRTSTLDAVAWLFSPELSALREDKSNLQLLKAMVASTGTQYLLNAETEIAAAFTAIATVLELFISGQSAIQDIRDLGVDGEGERAIVTEILVKQVPCDCLKGIYDETKKETKMGVCSYCGEEKVFKKLKGCSRCDEFAHYCNRECQVADWPEHKMVCDNIKSTATGRGK